MTKPFFRWVPSRITIELAARSIKVAHPEVKIASLDAWWIVAGKLLPKDTFEVWDGLGHGGEGETSLALSLFPELVNIDVASGVVPSLPRTSISSGCSRS